MTKVLIIYEIIPETTEFFLVDADDTEVSELKICHGHYINVVDNENIEKALCRLSLRISKPDHVDAESLALSGLEPDKASVWQGCQLPITEPISVADSGIELIIFTGFVL